MVQGSQGKNVPIDGPYMMQKAGELALCLNMCHESASIDHMIFTLSPPRHFVENNICGKCPHALTLVVVGSKRASIG